MGTELFKGFGVSVSAEVLKGLGPGIPQVTLKTRRAGTPDPDDLSAGAPITEQQYRCKGFLDTYDQRRFGSSEIAQGTRVIVILGDSLPASVVPVTEDRIVAEGSTFVLTGPVVRDPAGATYTCGVRA
jgi:hypothetical protein